MEGGSTPSFRMTCTSSADRELVLRLLDLLKFLGIGNLICLFIEGSMLPCLVPESGFEVADDFDRRAPFFPESAKEEVPTLQRSDFINLIKAISYNSIEGKQ